MFILLASTFLAVSCSKQSNALLPNVIPSDQAAQVPTEVGSIVDLGPVNQDTRAMQTNLNPQSFTLVSTNGESTVATAQLSLAYYVGVDYQIPSGTYVFSNSPDKAPFTFDSAALTGVQDRDGNPITPGNIVDGSVVVSQVDNNYVFQFQGQLDSGATFAVNVSGPMSYTDTM